jgi:hypothetical protein
VKKTKVVSSTMQAGIDYTPELVTFIQIEVVAFDGVADGFVLQLFGNGVVDQATQHRLEQFRS